MKRIDYTAQADPEIKKSYSNNSEQGSSSSSHPQLLEKSLSNSVNLPEHGFKQWDTQKLKIIKQASLDQLVDHLCVSFIENHDTNFIDIFFMTYKAFTSAYNLCIMLIDRFKKVNHPEYSKLLVNFKKDNEHLRKSVLKNPENSKNSNNNPSGLAQHKQLLRKKSSNQISNSEEFTPTQKLYAISKSITTVFIYWIQKYGFHDFKESNSAAFYPTLNEILDFSLEFLGCDSELHILAKNLNLKLLESHRKLVVESMNKIEDGDKLIGTGASHPHAQIGKEYSIKSLVLSTSKLALSLSGNPAFAQINLNQAEHFLQMTPQTIATQFLRIDSKLFSNLIPDQCLGCIWSKRQVLEEIQVSTVKNNIDNFNQAVYAVTGSILCAGISKTDRVAIICKWIEVANILCNKRDFSTLKAILSALQSQAIHRLKSHWQEVPKFLSNILEVLDDVFNESQKYYKVILNSDVLNKTEYYWISRKFDKHDFEFNKFWKLRIAKGWKETVENMKIKGN